MWHLIFWGIVACIVLKLATGILSLINGCLPEPKTEPEPKPKEPQEKTKWQKDWFKMSWSERIITGLVVATLGIVVVFVLTDNSSKPKTKQVTSLEPAKVYFDVQHEFYKYMPKKEAIALWAQVPWEEMPGGSEIEFYILENQEVFCFPNGVAFVFINERLVNVDNIENW